jgi:O-methyltransferase involved in polyketide biosynthesis
MAGMADLGRVQLGAVQETLFITLAARARETRGKRPVLRDPRAAEILAPVGFDDEKYVAAGAFPDLAVLLFRRGA